MRSLSVDTERALKLCAAWPKVGLDRASVAAVNSMLLHCVHLCTDTDFRGLYDVVAGVVTCL
jgi:hypothetical protein